MDKLVSSDVQHANMKYQPSEIVHNYGPHVHILSNPYTQSLLAQFGMPEVKHPLVNQLVQKLYEQLIVEVINTEFPHAVKAFKSRMHAIDNRGVFTGEVVADENVVIVDLARAGTYPSQICFDALNFLINPDNVRMDHFYVNRKTDAEGHVIGVDESGSKIGGGKENSFVLFPDPMGATGGSIDHVLNYYQDKVPGKEIKFITMHLVITPEYIKRLTAAHPNLEIYALRLDRGASSEDVLKTIPGTHPELESGLTDKQYILPGLGGVGELLSNSYC